MTLRDIFLTASANMFRSKLRTALTIVAIFIGAFTLTITSGIGSGISSYIDQQLGNLGAKDVLLIQGIVPSSGPATGTAEPKKYDPSKKISAATRTRDQQVLLTANDIDKIKAHPGVVSAAPSRTVSADYIRGLTGAKYQVFIAPNIIGSNLDLAAGKNINDNAADYQVVLPTNYLKSLGMGDAPSAVGKSVTLGLSNALGEEKEQSATIVGVQRQGIIGGGSVVINAPLADRLYAIASQGLPVAASKEFPEIQAKFSGNLTDAQITKLKSDLKSQGYSAQTVQDQIGTFKTVINVIGYVLDAFAIIALLAASFGIINTLLMSVQERTKEIGLMKSMGMGAGKIFLLFSTEAVLIGFWGSLLGVLVAFGLGQAVNRILARGVLKDLPGLNIVAFPLKSVVAIMLIIMVIAFLAGTLPARKASKQNPIEALRYE